MDLDAFFAAVEALENPALAGKPLVVGGTPAQRGVVSTASYEARAFGIHSAMPTSQALRLCAHLVIVPVRHSLYRSYSRRVMAILRETTPLVEQVSIDEAFLDLSAQIEAWDQAIEIARQLQQRIIKEVWLSCSLGVGTNKLVAKVASDYDKPGGLTIVRPGEEAAFLAPLPVRALWGVGPVTAEKLAAMGIETVGQLAQTPLAALQVRFGKRGSHMAQQARGIDRSPLSTEHERKSISQERTFSRDLRDKRTIKRHLWKMSGQVAEQLNRHKVAAGTIVLKLRYADFTTLTRQTSLTVPTDDAKTIYRTVLVLMSKAWDRTRAVRLLGVGAKNLSDPVGKMTLF